MCSTSICVNTHDIEGGCFSSLLDTQLRSFLAKARAAIVFEHLFKYMCTNDSTTKCYLGPAL